MYLQQYPAKILFALGETIRGNDKIQLWLAENGYPEIAAFSNAVRGSSEAEKFLLKTYPSLAALDAAIDNNLKAYLWLKKNNLILYIVFADACKGKQQAIDWLKTKNLDIFIHLAGIIRFYRENQYFDYHKKHF